MSKVIVLGAQHLGLVIAAGLVEKGHSVVLVDSDLSGIDLARGQIGIYEPGVLDVLRAGLSENRFALLGDTLAPDIDADIVWAAFDTPVNEADIGDTGYVEEKIVSSLNNMPSVNACIISSQVPLSSVENIIRESPSHLAFCVSPENLRLGSSLDYFVNLDRLVMGVVDPSDREYFKAFGLTITSNVLLVSHKAAILGKHALNSFLATSVSFINEIARLSDDLGVNCLEVAEILMSDKRIGADAYLRPGPSFSGGTLARDLRYIEAMSLNSGIVLPLLSSVLPSNELHADWPVELILRRYPKPEEIKISILGLAYKSGTDSIRRSYSIDLGKKLRDLGFSVVFYDPRVSDVPSLPGRLLVSVKDLVGDADLIVCMTTEAFPVDEIKAFLNEGKTLSMLDMTRMLESEFSSFEGLDYFSIGYSRGRFLDD